MDNINDLKVYNKAGKHNYKEKHLQRLIREALIEKSESNPEILKGFSPANTYEELQALHDKFAVTDVQYSEVKAGANESASTSSNESSDENSGGSADEFPTSEEREIDPLNKANPKVRDYVTDQGFSQNGSGPVGGGQTDFAEPHDFKDAFEFPDENGNTSSGPSSGPSNQGGPKKTKPIQPLNPELENTAANNKNRTTKRFAKYLVEAIVMLAENGFEWYATKDINDAALAAYELNDEMDLTLLLSLNDSQTVTVKEFFQMQCKEAKTLSKIDPEDKKDLIDALANYMMEKNVAPTPAQELMVVSLTILGKQAIALMVFKAQTGSVLNQLRVMKSEEQSDATVEDVKRHEPPKQEQKRPETEKRPADPPPEEFVEAPLPSEVERHIQNEERKFNTAKEGSFPEGNSLILSENEAVVETKE